MNSNILADGKVTDRLNAMIENMRRQSDKMKVSGVAVAACYRNRDELVSHARVCGKFADEKHNYLAIAYAKMSEMCNTLSDSGQEGRKILNGELGYTGGAIKSVGDLHYVAAFSGAKSEDDLAISKRGLDAI